MNHYELSIFVPLKHPPHVGHHLVHVFTLATQATLDDIRAHADVLADKIMPGARYDALNVREATP